jgi:hypothetical protein
MPSSAAASLCGLPKSDLMATMSTLRGARPFSGTFPPLSLRRGNRRTWVSAAACRERDEGMCILGRSCSGLRKGACGASAVDVAVDVTVRLDGRAAGGGRGGVSSRALTCVLFLTGVFSLALGLLFYETCFMTLGTPATATPSEDETFRLVCRPEPSLFATGQLLRADSGGKAARLQSQNELHYKAYLARNPWFASSEEGGLYLQSGKLLACYAVDVGVA